MSACLLPAPFDGDGDPVPHPGLVRAQRPGTALFMAAALSLGPFPERSYLGGETHLSLPA